MNEQPIINKLLNLVANLEVSPAKRSEILDAILELQRCHLRDLEEHANRAISIMKSEYDKESKNLQTKLNNILGMEK